MAVEPRIGTAGWSIPKRHAGGFPSEGSGLTRYAKRFAAVEINSSFYHSHRPATYSRWAASVPNEFRFAVKMPRTITHELRLEGGEALLDGFRAEVGELGTALGPALVQLPPSLPFEEKRVRSFLDAARLRFNQLVCEPRHETWFTDEADDELERFHVARVAADPAIVPRAAVPGGWRGMSYRRLHGAPQIYRSAYSTEALADLADQLRIEAQALSESWCIFDNTTLGEATRNAMELQKAV